VYQGETFTIHYYLYSIERVVNYTTNPLTSMEGFMIDRFLLHNNPLTSKKMIGGKEYTGFQVASLTLTATASGEFVFPAKTFRISVRQMTQSRSIWDDPFFGSGTTDINVHAPGDTVSVFPLPPGGGPYFTGAIGEFSLMTDIDSTRIRENQATTLRVSLVGRGNLQHFAFPEQTFSREFEVFEPKVRNNYKLNSQDYQGERTWEYILIPSKTGVYAFDDIRFTYFSLKDKRYKTVYMSLENIHVIARDELKGDYSSLSPEQVRLLSTDIRFLQMNETRCVDGAHAPLSDPRIWFGYYIAALLAVIFLAADFYLAFRNKNIKKIRYKNALKTAAAHFKQITHALPPEQILLQVEAGIRTYLEDKQLQAHDFPVVKDLIKTIETYKYAPGMLSNMQLDTLKDKALSIIEGIEAE
ncbi:MAG: BatD family protein, partial [FCB group bacterium]|nr:BatD family protein [FCB group bacterium]